MPRDADPDSFVVAHRAAHPNIERLSERNVDAEAEAKLHIIEQVAEGRRDDGMNLGGEADLGLFQQDLAPERNAERDQESGVSAGKQHPEAAGHRSVEREILAVMWRGRRAHRYRSRRGCRRCRSAST